MLIFHWPQSLKFLNFSFCNLFLQLLSFSICWGFVHGLLFEISFPQINSKWIYRRSPSFSLSYSFLFPCSLPSLFSSLNSLIFNFFLFLSYVHKILYQDICINHAMMYHCIITCLFLYNLYVTPLLFILPHAKYSA